MFTKEFNVKGNIINGRIFGNWSHESYYCLEVRNFNVLKWDEQDLNKLITELTSIRDKVKELNVEYNSLKDIK